MGPKQIWVQKMFNKKNCSNQLWVQKTEVKEQMKEIQKNNKTPLNPNLMEKCHVR